MNRQQYDAYTAKVREFFKTEGITNLSMIGENPESYFSWNRCDCCERSLGGNRYDCNGWNPTLKQVQEYSVCEDCIYYAEYGQLDDMTMLDIEESRL